jgi:hypothetical protein
LCNQQTQQQHLRLDGVTIRTAYQHATQHKYERFFYSPTDAQVNCLKNDIKIYFKINTKTAATCFGAITPSSGSALFDLANCDFKNCNFSKHE